MITKIIICIIIVTYCHYIVTVYITFNITTTKSITMSLYCYYRFVMVLIIAVVVIAYYCNNCNTLDSVQFSVQFWFEALCVQIARRPPHSNAFIVLISDVLQNLQIVTHQNPQNPHSAALKQCGPVTKSVLMRVTGEFDGFLRRPKHWSCTCGSCKHLICPSKFMAHHGFSPYFWDFELLVAVPCWKNRDKSSWICWINTNHSILGCLLYGRPETLVDSILKPYTSTKNMQLFKIPANLTSKLFHCRSLLSAGSQVPSQSTCNTKPPEGASWSTENSRQVGLKTVPRKQQFDQFMLDQPFQDVSRCFKIFQNVSSCFKMSQVVSRCFKMFQDVSRCSKMFQVVSRCFKLFKDVSRCFKMFQDVSRCFKMFQEVSKWFKMFQDVSRCVKMCQDVSRCLEMFRDVSRCFKMFQDVSSCFKMIQDFSRCVKMVQDVSSCVKLCQDVSRCFKMFQNGSRCFKMVQDVSRCFKMFQDVTRCHKMFQGVSRCVKLFQDVSRCFKLFQAVSSCVKMFQDVSRCFKAPCSILIIICHLCSLACQFYLILFVWWFFLTLPVMQDLWKRQLSHAVPVPCDGALHNVRTVVLPVASSWHTCCPTDIKTLHSCQLVKSYISYISLS